MFYTISVLRITPKSVTIGVNCKKDIYVAIKKYWQRSGKAYQTLTLIYLPMQLDQELSFSMKKVPSL
jgi:hypothetical protein